jgi:hypothetical protein
MLNNFVLCGLLQKIPNYLSLMLLTPQSLLSYKSSIGIRSSHPPEEKVSKTGWENSGLSPYTKMGSNPPFDENFP